ncbi:MAG: hypothetical protein M3Q94_18850, partial [Pseudomonadota bacterium]|nr:hypothetical protein [Pseudomonadota bacterium]
MHTTGHTKNQPSVKNEDFIQGVGWSVGCEVFPNARNDKALNNQGFIDTNMAEAMGFELMDLLQSTVFKTVALNHSAT